MKEKKKYEKPQMQVFELRQHPQLLAGSNEGNREIPQNDPYTPGGSPFTF